jgi:ABC-type branched-subunit amino acid transport system ATPase component
VFEKIHQVAQAEDVSMLLLEQNIGRALAVSTRAYVLRSGRIVESVDAEELLERGQESWWDLV